MVTSLDSLLCATAMRMKNRFHKTLGVLHIVKLASWLRFAEGALQLKPTTLVLTRRQQSAEPQDKLCQVGVTVNAE